MSVKKRLFLTLLFLCTSMVYPTMSFSSSGQKVFKQCISCHNFKSHKIGPSLKGIIGRKIGSMPNYRYSKAMRKAGSDDAIWTLSKLDEFLKKPSLLIKKTKMVFSGIKEKRDRTAVIEYMGTQ